MSTLYVGLDAGGSKTALVAATEDSDNQFEIVGAAANVQRLGADATASVLAGLILDAARHHPGTTMIKACVGIAGAGRAEDALSVTEKWRRLLEPEFETRLLVVHDGEIALDGAFRGESGAVVIAGTGSLILARTRSGELVRAGGWGYLLGDEGSGYAIGLAGMRAVAAAIDADKSIPLLDLLATDYGLSGRDEIIAAVYRNHFPVQTVAPAVIQLAARRDDLCTEIIRSQTRELASQVATTSGRWTDIEPRVALVGGLVRSNAYESALSDAILETLPDWKLVAPFATPAAGALERARKL